MKLLTSVALVAALTGPAAAVKDDPAERASFYLAIAMVCDNELAAGTWPLYAKSAAKKMGMSPALAQKHIELKAIEIASHVKTDAARKVFCADDMICEFHQLDDGAWGCR